MLPATGPLTGTRIVEFSGIGPAPFCGMLLADLGADVVRVDRPGPAASGIALEPTADLLNRSKRSIVIDLKRPAGTACALRLIERCDATIEGYRPGVMERLGLGPDACLAINRRLVYGRMTGWGQSGPLAARAGHDINYIAITGALDAIGREHGGPVPPLNLVGDFGGGALYLALGIVAALLHAARTGEGQVVDAAIVDGTASLMTAIHAMAASGVWSDRRGRNLLDSGCPWYDVYPTSDGGYVAVGPIEPAFYDRFVTLLLGHDPDLPGQWEVDRWPALRDRFAAAFRTRTREEWRALFEPEDACVAPVVTLGESIQHPHLLARGTFQTVAGTTQPAPAPRFSRTPGTIRDAPHRPGHDARAVLSDAGYDADAIDRLIEDSVVREAQP